MNKLAISLALGLALAGAIAIPALVAARKVAEPIENTRPRVQTSFARRIRQAKMGIDMELGIAKGAPYREQLVKAAYSLVNLQNQVLRQNS